MDTLRYECNCPQCETTSVLRCKLAIEEIEKMRSPLGEASDKPQAALSPVPLEANNTKQEGNVK